MASHAGTVKGSRSHTVASTKDAEQYLQLGGNPLAKKGRNIFGLLSPRSRTKKRSSIQVGDNVIETVLAAPRLHEGWLVKCGENMKSWKKRWFVLVESFLFYINSKNDKEVLGVIPLQLYECKDAPEVDKPHCFKMTGTGGSLRTYLLCASTAEEGSEWVSTTVQMISAARDAAAKHGDTLLPESFDRDEGIRSSVSMGDLPMMSAGAPPPPPMGNAMPRQPASDAMPPPPPMGDVMPPPPGADVPPPPGGTAAPPPPPPPPTSGAMRPPPSLTVGAMPPPPTNDAMLPPPAGDAMLPPPSDDAMLPPPAGDAMLPPPSDDAMLPPPSDDAMLPPPSDDAMLPPPSDDAMLPPPGNDTMFPPPAGDAMLPPPADDAMLPPPAVDGAGLPPPMDFPPPMAPAAASQPQLDDLPPPLP